MRNVRFWVRNNDLSVVGVLHDLCVAGVQAQVIDERAEENWAQARALEDALIDCQTRRSTTATIRASDANTLSMTFDIVFEPGSVDSEQLQFFNSFPWSITSKHLLRSIKHSIET